MDHWIGDGGWIERMWSSWSDYLILLHKFAGGGWGSLTRFLSLATLLEDWGRKTANKLKAMFFLIIIFVFFFYSHCIFLFFTTVICVLFYSFLYSFCVSSGRISGAADILGFQGIRNSRFVFYTHLLYHLLTYVSDMYKTNKYPKCSSLILIYFIYGRYISPNTSLFCSNLSLSSSLKGLYHEIEMSYMW